MIPPLAKLIDWATIQIISMRRPPIDGGNQRLEEALRFLNGPDFIPTESQPAQVKLESIRTGRFCFPTPRLCEVAENNIVYGRLYPCAERWRERPVVVLLHGGGNYAIVAYRFLFPIIAPQCNRAGFNAAALVAPYHFQRCPAQPGALSQTDYLRRARTTGQAVAEIRALTGWFLQEGCPAVALWGSSYGAWLAGLAACHDPRLTAVVLAKPTVRPHASFAERIVRRRLREALLGQGAAREKLCATPLNLTTAQPVIPKTNVLLIEALHDWFIPKEHIEELCSAWRQPEIWRVPHGHVSLSLMVPGFTGRVLRWLEPRLNGDTVRTLNK
jgi:dienelactone hydrolase